MNQINSKKKERDILFDLVKGFTIILVVLGHCIQFGNGSYFLSNGLFFDEIPFKIIYSFHMPLFMLISGYFFYFTAKKYTLIKDLIFNRITKLLIPILTWNILFFFAFYSSNLNNNAENEIIYFVKSIFTNLWFLWAIFWCSFIVMIIRNYLNDSMYFYFLIFVVSFLIPDVLNLSLYKFMYPFFVIGFLYNKNKEFIDSKFTKIKHVYLLCITTIVYLVLMYWYDFDSYIYTSGHTIIGSNTTGYSLVGKHVVSQICIDLYRYSVGLVGSIFVILGIGYLLKINAINKGGIIAKLGVDSLGIYIISGFFFPILSVICTQSSLNYVYTLLETIIVIVLSFVLIIPLKRYKLINKIFFGGR